MRTLESKIDAMQSRNDRLQQSYQAAAPRESLDLAEVRADLASLRSQIDDVERQQSKLGDVLDRFDAWARDQEAASEGLSNRVEKQTLRLTESQERAGELADRIESLQGVVHGTIETLNNSRAEWIAHESARSREITGRMVGLYVIGCVALTVAIATLIIVLTRVGL